MHRCKGHCNRYTRRSPRCNRLDCDAQGFDAALLGPSSDAVKSYLERVDNVVSSLGNDVLQVLAAGKVLSDRFLFDWNSYLVEWRAYYARNTGILATVLGGSEITTEVQNYEQRLEGFRTRFSSETQIKPTMQQGELPSPPTPAVGTGSGFDFGSISTPIVAIAGLAALVIFGPALARRM